MNAPEVRMASLPAFGGIGTARALAKFYAVLAEGGSLEGRRYLAETTARRLRATLVQGPDKVLVSDTAFTLGFMKDPVDALGQKRGGVFGPSLSAFGQPGAGGSTAFADPENRFSFAYVMNQMEAGVLPNPKSLALIEALYE
jgi:CubicO group peptidase (beta-lactamase class C family)